MPKEKGLELARSIVANSFYVEIDLPGYVKGGFYDATGGTLVGVNAAYVADTLNVHAKSIVHDGPDPT